MGRADEARKNLEEALTSARALNMHASAPVRAFAVRVAISRNVANCRSPMMR